MAKPVNKKQAGKYQPPKGFTVCASGGMTQSIDWDKTPVVEGEIIDIKTFPEKVGKDKKGKKVILRKETRLMVIKKSDKSEVAVWEKKDLENLFDSVEIGNDVYIAHVGTIDIPGRKLPMHQFTSAFK